MKRLFIVLAILVLCTIVAISCAPATQAPPATKPTTTPASPAVTPATPAKPSEPTPQYGGVLKRLSAFLPGTSIGLPWEALGASRGDTCPALEGLILNDVHNKITYKLATGFEVAPDKMSIKINLRKGVKFHDGTDFNATAAKWAMDQWINAKKAPQWKSVEIIDDYTIRLNLTNWENSVILGLNTRIFISPAAYEKNGVDWARWNPVGTGPFKFAGFVRDTSLKVTKFDGYWNKGLPYLDGIEFIYIADRMTMTASFKAGQGHSMRMGTLQTVAQLRDQGYEVITTLSVGATKAPLALFPDSKNPDSPYSKVKVREAVEYAIDKEGIVQARGFGFWAPSYQFPIKNTDYYIPSLPERRYNPAKAKQLLTEAGYPNGFKTRIVANPGLVDQDAVVAIQSQLKAVGIDTDVELSDAAKFAVYQQKGWSNALLVSNASGGSPNFASGLKTGLSKYASTCYSVLIPDAYQIALDECLTTLEIDKAKTQSLVKMLYDDVTLIPLYYNFEGDPMVKGIHNLGSEIIPGDPIGWTPDICWMEKSAWIP